MAHIRQSIRDAVVTALTGLTTTATRVERSRVYDVASLPSLSIYTLEDALEEDSETFSDDQFRRIALTVEARAKATANVDTTLDTIDSEVSVALYGDAALALLIKDIRWTGASIEFEQQEQPIGLNTITFDILYRTDATNPTAALA